MSSPDVVVVGGGIVGAACGYFLAREGLSVHLLERSSLASGTSGACEGNLLLWDKELTKELPLGKRSMELWAQLHQELDADFEYDRKGSLMVAENEAGMVATRTKLRDLASADVPGAFLDGRDLRNDDPQLAKDLPGGALFPDDVQVEPRLATVALIQGARRHGLVIQTGTTVRRVVLGSGDRVESVETDGGSIPTGAVVVAAGVWTREIAATAGLNVPVYPRKGQIVVTERSPLLIRRKMMEAAYTSTVESGRAGLQVATVVESTRSGVILLGSSRQLAGYDRTADTRVSAAIAARAVRFYPALAGVRCLRSYSGLRPFSPDHLPLIGPVAGAEGFYVAAGHEGAGICLSPATGVLITQWLAGRPLDFPAEWFSPDRFQVSSR